MSRDTQRFKELKKQVDLISKFYHQPALVEEFIKGTEYTVAVLGNENPQAMPVAQVSIDGDVQLGDEFFTFERVSSRGLQYVCPAQIPDKLAREIQRLAVLAYQSVECHDFGRVDFRADERGRAYVLEINPLPSLAEVDVFNIFPKVIGSSYEEIINRVVDYAFKRYGLNGKPALNSRRNVIRGAKQVNMTGG